MLKFQNFGHLRQRTDSLEKTVMPEKTGKEEKGATENEMVGWHHRLNGHESELTLGESEGQGILAWFNSWGQKELDGVQ